MPVIAEPHPRIYQELRRMAAEQVAIGRPRNIALKDARLEYRACTLGYAHSLQLSSPTQLVGQTDFDFLSDRSAALVHAAEQRVLQTGIAEITDGQVLSKRTAGKFFVRSPVFNQGGQICGIEIFVVSIDELHKSYKLLLSGESQLRNIINQSPFGLLIHRDYEVLYLNETWSALMGSAGTTPSASELRKLIPNYADGKLHAISSIHADGQELELHLQSRSVHWNSAAAQAVYCVPTMVQPEARVRTDAVGGSDLAIGGEQKTDPNYGQNHSQNNDLISGASFAEKRHGRRRTTSDTSVAPGFTVDENFFNHLTLPMIVCEGWFPVQANQAAQVLLIKDSEGSYRSVEDWFDDRDRSKLQALFDRSVTIDKSNSDEQFVNLSIERGSRLYYAQVSNLPGGYSLIALQVAAEHHNQQQQTIARLHDYVSSAGDFFWEMDAEQRLTHVSKEMREFLGVESSQLLNVRFEALILQYVHEEDQAEWKVLMADLRKHLPFRNREYKWMHQDSERRVVRLSGVPVFDSAEKFCGYRGVGWDYTAQHHSASIVAYHASHDSLTGLVNRREFEVRCDEAIKRSEMVSQALCFIDLDKFKRVNDTAGHLAGDELLRQLSKLFTGLVRKSDVLARLGGDEFGLLIYDVGLKEAMRLATQLCVEVDSFIFQWEGKQFSVGASIGLVLLDSRWDTRSKLFGAADAACYQAKNEGRNRVAVYNEHGALRTTEQSDQDKYIKEAIGEQRIKLAMQRIASPDGTDRSTSKIEVLMRMFSPEGELLLPADVLPVAEKSGLSVDLDKAVVDATVDWLEGQPHVTDGLDLCCINLSRASIADDAFLVYLIEMIEKSGVDASILCFEISESAVSSNLGSAAVFMEKLGELGCQFAMDNFNGGISAFTCLKKLPVSYVKINGTFVEAILEDPIHYAMVKSINEVVQSLGKQTIAESVESEAVHSKLYELGVNLVQGYYISAPEIIDY